MMTNSKIENISKDILIKFNLLKAPIDVEAVASKLGVEISQQDLDDSVSGFFVKKGDKNIIGLNQNHHSFRKRFTISHEIGHFKLHSDKPLFIDHYKGSILYRSNNRPENYTVEKEANFFAATLLMPKVVISKEINNLKESLDYDEKLSELSLKFQVSKQAMDYRLKSLGYYEYGF